MSKIDEVRADMVKAMKAGDKDTKETLDMTPADRTEIIEECNRRLSVLEPVSYTHLDVYKRQLLP